VSILFGARVVFEGRINRDNDYLRP
jgi:hypothetical protein